VEDPRRIAAALRARYAGTALAGLLILLYVLGRALASWWRG